MSTESGVVEVDPSLPWWKQEDIWANLLGGTILTIFLAIVGLGVVTKKDDLTKFFARPGTTDKPFQFHFFEPDR